MMVYDDGVWVHLNVSQRLCRIGGALLCDIYTEDINKTGTYMEDGREWACQGMKQKGRLREENERGNKNEHGCIELG